MSRLYLLLGLLLSSWLFSQTERETAIEQVVILNASDPRALAILDKVSVHYDQNSPKSLPAYTYRSYEKLALDLSADSLALYKKALGERNDTLRVEPSEESPKKGAKSVWNRNKFENFAAQSSGFLWERAMEYRFSKSEGEKTLVLDSRISGLTQPLYRFLALRSDRDKTPKVIDKKNRSLYRFFLTDTLYLEGRETYEISFRELAHDRPHSGAKFNGRILVDAQSYGVKQIESQRSSGSKRSKVSSWRLLGGKWFLEHEDLEIKIGALNLAQQQPELKSKQDFGYYASLSVDYFDWDPKASFEPKDFKGYELEVVTTSGEKLETYRPYDLTPREKNSYQKIDSIGKRDNWQKKAGILSALTSGKLRVGKLDFLAEDFARYSKYEGLRLGIGAKLNETFSPRWSPEVSLAYGFRDKEFKYGAALEYRTSLSRHSMLRAEYFSDVKASGLFNEELWSFKMKLMNAGVNVSNEKYFQTKGFGLSWEYDLRSDLTMKLGAKRARNTALFDYDFANLGAEFQEFKVSATLKYAPGSKSLMTPAGKFTYHVGYPEFYLHYEQGLSLLGGQSEFKKIELLFTHQFKTPLGLTGTRAYMGKITGEVPIWNQFQMNGLSGKTSGTSFTLTSYLGFATMPGGTYFNDQFFGYYLTHRLPWYFKSIGHNASSFDVLYKGVVGEMQNAELHQFEFHSLNKLYQEVGLEWNNFLSSHFNLGFFYRVGHYQTQGFKGNFAVQLKLKLLGF